MHTASRLGTFVGKRLLVVATVFLLLPAMAFAQASITGVVRDTSGAVLPGVTVEAASPVLIEKVRTVVSDDGGQYRIVDLRPGTYTVTFALPGFSTFKRDGIELSGNFTASVNAELRVGELAETVTVSGQAPIVDVQQVSTTQAISSAVIAALPTGRNYSNLSMLIPGVSGQCQAGCGGVGTQDVGGALGDARLALTVHGSRFRDQRMAISGMTLSGTFGGQVVTGPNMEAMQEMQLETSSADATNATGGVGINLVPKDGGNNFAGSLFITGTNQHFQDSNISQELIGRGLNIEGRAGVKTLYDIAPTFGGPVLRDKLWFFLSGRLMDNQSYVTNLFRNKNEGDPTKWLYEKDLTRQVVFSSPLDPVGVRLTWQATPRNKFAASVDLRDRCDCPNVGAGTTSLEAVPDWEFRPDNIYMAQWSSPLTNRLLLEAGFIHLAQARAFRIRDENLARLTRVVNQTPRPGEPGTYRGLTGLEDVKAPFNNIAGSATYVSGAHALKMGLTWNWGYADSLQSSPGPMTSYAFANGVPTSFTVNSDPRRGRVNLGREVGLYLQDKWTIDRLTLSGGLRYDNVYRYSSEVRIGPAPLLPNRNFVFPETDFTRHHDISPRAGAVYDLFGNGKTAVKAQLNRYVIDESLGSGNTNGTILFGVPHFNVQYAATRAWVDNGNFIPDCDIADGRLQDHRATGGDLCGAFAGASADFGRFAPTTVDDPDVDFGWGKRGYNWLVSASVQQELVPQRLSVDVGYFRRWFGNFLVTDNLSLSPSDFTAFSVTLPNDPRLPQSGQTISGFLNVNPDAATRPQNNILRRSQDYGDQYEYWHGVDVTFNARLAGGSLVQGGMSTGKTVTDDCDILTKVPENGVWSQLGIGAAILAVGGPLAGPYCHQETAWLTQVKLLGTYTVPRVDLQVSATFQGLPGPMISANLVVPSAQVATSLGRPLSGNAANVTVPIVGPGDLYGDWLNQLDLRVGKTLRFGPRRVTASIDLYNILNSSAVLAESANYSSFRTPIRVLGARLLKFTASMNF